MSSVFQESADSVTCIISQSDYYTFLGGFDFIGKFLPKQKYTELKVCLR